VWKCYTTKTPWIAFNNEYAEVNTIEADICVANVIGGTIGENGRATLQLQSKCSESLLAKNLTVIALITFHFTCFSGVDIIPAISMPTCIVFTNENINLSEREVHELVSSISYMRDSLQIGAEVYPQCIREVRLKDGDLGSAYVFECPGYVSIGGKIWDATYALLDYIQDHPELISGKRVVELGCGTGALGMSIASLPRKPASITLTDTAELMPLVSANLKLNRLFQEHTNLNCKECQYNWGDDGPVVHDELLPCDVIIAADVVYDSDFFNDLLQAIHDLLETPQSTCISSRVEEISDLSDTPTTASSHERIMILAYRKRNDDEHR
jgi:2-polyprenyl-3-methyl-5-hydroxy-6-metoxy-1,4-benzoquinol methylase